MSDELIFNHREEVLQVINNTRLFYPCCGRDLMTPISLFSPYVNDFWFIDRSYFVRGSQDTSSYGWDMPPHFMTPLLAKKDDYKLIQVDVQGDERGNINSDSSEMCILTEAYLHVPSEKTVKIRRCRGYAIPVFHSGRLGKLGVFFYRGDSEGEGGSGDWWLASDNINRICESLIDGGLIVTDGSQSGRLFDIGGRQYDLLSKYRHEDLGSMTMNELVESIEPFTDEKGRVFTCLGFAGRSYGPTLIWQVMKPRG